MTVAMLDGGATESARAKRPRRRPVPNVLQIEAVECGAASLAMILAYYGAWVPLERLRAACGVSRDGSKASNILRAARGFGLGAKGYKKEVETLRELPWPLILHWNFNHYVVFEGMNATHAFINDPGSGARKLTLAEFDEAFTGVALAFEKTKAFVSTGRPRGLLASLRQRVTGSGAVLRLIGVLSLAIVLPGVALPVFSKLFVDGIVLRQQTHWVAPLLIVFAFTALLRALLTILRQSAMLRFETKLTIVGAGGFLWHVIHLPVAFFGQRQPGEVASRIDASQRVAKTISGDLANALVDVGSAVAFALIMVGYDPILGLAAIGLMLPNVIISRLLRRSLSDTARLQSVDMGKLAGATVGMISNIESIKASGLERSSFSQWAGFHAKVLDSAQRFGSSAAIIQLLPSLSQSVIEVAILGLGAYRVLIGVLTVGDLVAFQVLAQSFAAPLGRVMSLSVALTSVKADLNRVSDALRNAVDPLTAVRHDVAAADDLSLRGQLRIDQLEFGYNPMADPLLRNIDLSVMPGDRVALVGRSGCGKSTLGRLICGLVEPSAGSIRVDNVALPDLTQHQRAANIAYVDQDIFLFEGSVRDNLTLWDRSMPDHVLTQALKDAALLDDIVVRPGELDAIVEEGGRNFSGGQRQRLEIARALVGNPSLLVLDEATAALDPETEMMIDRNLRRRGCTCIIIAHRLSTVRDCSEIVVMRSGEIIERGTHESLMDLGGEYAELARAG